MTATLQDPPPQPAPETQPARKRPRRASSMVAQGEPMVWLTGGALTFCLVMIFGLLGLVLWQGGSTFWPHRIVQIEDVYGAALLGELSNEESFTPGADYLEALDEESRARLNAALDEGDGSVRRRQLRTGNFLESGTNYDWISDAELGEADEVYPEWALVVERQTTGRLYGIPVRFIVDGEVFATEPADVWERMQEHHADVRARFEQALSIERGPAGRINRTFEQGRLALETLGESDGQASERYRAMEARLAAETAELQPELEALEAEVDVLRELNSRYRVAFALSDGQEVVLPLDEVVRAVNVNQLDFSGKLGVYFDRWQEFLFDQPRKANSQGGVWPAIFGTVIMTLIMSILVVPFGVLAALYLHEYAKQGMIISLVRIAVNNLAGVPSIVFGVFGLGFFCYIIGGGIDGLFFSDKLPNPTYGKGGILWASLTLALLTLPVVIVATEEALSAVPNSMREGSYACGATKWQTIKRIVLPRAQPGIMTGMILAIARGAGEVAPLMLVGASKVAPDLPVDLSTFPYVFPERSFMHLGYHIFDVGFQSQNSEAAKPMVYTTTLLLIAIVVVLNLLAILIRARLRRRFQAAH